jgi:hypothetical protein
MRRSGRLGSNWGVRALSRETGYSAATISRKLSRGLSPDNIRSQARLVVAQERREAAAVHAAGSTPPLTAGNPSDPSPERPPTSDATLLRPAVAHAYEDLLAGDSVFEQLEEAKLRRAKALAERQELENMLRRGELMPVSYVRAWASRFLIDGRDELLKGPSELADSLAAETDPLKVASILRAWLERAIGKFEQLEQLWQGGDQSCPH